MRASWFSFLNNRSSKTQEALAIPPIAQGGLYQAASRPKARPLPKLEALALGQYAGVNQTSLPFGPHSIDEDKLKTKQYLKQAQRSGVPGLAIELLDQDLRPLENELALRAEITRNFSGDDRDACFQALSLAKQAHAGQYQVRKSEANTGLGHIPYVNHPIQLARKSIALCQSADCVQACLLHDMVEDTPVTIEEIKVGFSPKVESLVKDLTQTKSETRAAYLERIKKLEGESAFIKGIDRLHNVLRAFTSKDTDYLDRYIKETESVYAPKFKSHPELSKVQDEFRILMGHLKLYRRTLG